MDSSLSFSSPLFVAQFFLSYAFFLLSVPQFLISPSFSHPVSFSFYFLLYLFVTACHLLPLHPLFLSSSLLLPPTLALTRLCRSVHLSPSAQPSPPLHTHKHLSQKYLYRKAFLGLSYCPTSDHFIVTFARSERER